MARGTLDPGNTALARNVEAGGRDDILLPAVFETAPVLIAVLDYDGRIVRFNPSCEAATRYSTGEVLGRYFWEVLAPPENSAAARTAFARMRAGDQPSRIELPLYTRDKETRPVAWHSGVSGHGGGLVICVGVDLTGQKELEQSLRQSQKMEAIGRLAGGVAHDFNNILTTITGYTELLLEVMPEDHPMRKDLLEIQKAGELGASLTRRLLAFSRKQVLKPQPLDLNGIVTGLRNMLHRLIGEDIELVIQLDPGLGSTMADPGQIDQVLMNLAVNARDAMPQGGRLVIQTANVNLRDPNLARALDIPPGLYVMLSVADSGCGMDDETRLRLFEPFFTTKEPGRGTGLGLAMVYGIVRQSGGGIALDTAPRRGARFDIYLPRTDQDVAVLDPALQDEHASGTETLLVVEDEADVRALVRRVLERHGYRVLEAADGEEALCRARAYGATIHLLLTDVVLPGIGGPELARSLMAERPGMKCILMSGYIDSPRSASVNGLKLLHKPFSTGTLTRKVRELLDA